MTAPSATPLLRRDRDPTLLSVVVPAFNEEGNLRVLYSALAEVLEGLDWELVFVDDGSKDRTFPMIMELSQEDPRVRGVSFSRNFGHQYALLAGLKAARGEAVVSMDADMQHPPATVPALVEAWRQGYNVVHTQRRPNANLTWFKKTTSNLYYRLFSALSGVPLKEGQSDFRLLDRRVVDVILSLDTAELFLRGLVHWVGYQNTTLSYDVGKRHWGVSKYNLRKMIRFAIQGITSFSTFPLRIGIAIGFLTSLIAFAEFGFVVLSYLSGETVPGWASLAALTSLLFAVSFALIGFIGIYVGHVFARVQRLPQYLVETTTEEVKKTGDP